MIIHSIHFEFPLERPPPPPIKRMTHTQSALYTHRREGGREGGWPKQQPCLEHPSISNKNASPSMTPNTTTDRWTPSTSIDHWLPKTCLRLDGLFSSLQTYQPTRHDPTSSAMKEVLKRSGRLHHQTKNLISKENAKQSFSKTLWWYTGVHGHTT